MKTVFALGDSWFNYFFTDLTKVLQDSGFAVERVASPGDTLQSIASREPTDPRGPQLDRLQALLGAAKTPPRAILLSAGGDDVVALDPPAAPDTPRPRRLKRLLNRAGSGSDVLNEAEVQALVDVDMKNALTTILQAITDMCESRFPGSPVPIVIHGYAHPVADGRRGPFGQGPWLGPTFAEQGYGDRTMKTRLKVMRDLIDKLNSMQTELRDDPRFRSHVTHVDLREVLSAQADDYRKLWENELHPTRHGFQLVGRRIAEVLDAL